MSQDGPNFEKSVLIPVVAQDEASGDVLMLAYMNQEAYDETLRTGRLCYYSRSRKKLGRKGESGNVQELKSIYYDCDADTLLREGEPDRRGALPEGYKSCFFRKIDPATQKVEVVGERQFDRPRLIARKTGWLRSSIVRQFLTDANPQRHPQSGTACHAPIPDRRPGPLPARRVRRQPAHGLGLDAPAAPRNRPLLQRPPRLRPTSRVEPTLAPSAPKTAPGSSGRRCRP